MKKCSSGKIRILAKIKQFGILRHQDQAGAKHRHEEKKWKVLKSEYLFKRPWLTAPRIISISAMWMTGII